MSRNEWKPTEKGAREGEKKLPAFRPPRYVHGDPVFSNALLTNDSRVKFLDMRGALGDVLTTKGDVAYDLSKVYQSLCGYDFIILDAPLTPVHAENLARLRRTFEAYVAARYPAVDLRDIKMIVAAHFFCIVPLHDNAAHQRAFLEACASLLAEDAAAPPPLPPPATPGP